MSPLFRVEEGELTGLVLSLAEGNEWVLGRDPAHCSLLLEDADVDRIQFMCKKVEDTYVIENQSITHPVTINGRLLDYPHVLAEGDRIAIGRTILIFTYEQSIEALSSASIEETNVTQDDPQGGFIIQRDAPNASPQDLENQMVENAWAALGQDIENIAEEGMLDELSAVENTEEVSKEFLDEDRLESYETSVLEESQDADASFDMEEQFHMDLTPSSRFTLKVIAGPNTGAEFAIDLDKTYLIGTDTTTCDIIFHDLSVSREHARLQVSQQGELFIEDLNSRNGVVIDQMRIKARSPIAANSIITVGTTSFFLIDKEAPQETIITPMMEPRQQDEEQEVVESSNQDESAEELVIAESSEQIKEEPLPSPSLISAHLPAAVVLSAIIVGVMVLLGYGIFALSQAKDATAALRVPSDYLSELDQALKPFPAVRYTYNRMTKQLFLVGHVATSIEYSELHYNLQGMPFILGIQNNVVNDEAVWQEMNLILAKHPEFKGVSMHSPQPGIFVISGYLKTEAQAANLVDYLNIHFNYLDLLENRVIVEEEVAEEVSSLLFNKGFGAITSSFINGDLSLTGYIGANQARDFDKLVEQLSHIPGVRHTQNFVVVVTVDQQVVDLSQRYPGRYVVTGYSKHGDVNINVVINGRILMRGDVLDNMTITSIQPRIIFLEKDGLKYKIEYNK